MINQFNSSPICSIGVELELQIINLENYDLLPYAENFLQHIDKKTYPGEIKPEITQSMLEINSTPTQSINSLLSELLILRQFIVEQSQELNIGISGGGTHPFQKWYERKIFPKIRYQQLYEKYNFLAKKFTTFGQHIHIGCGDGEKALYLIHALARYVPHLIALSASSPFYEGENTEFSSSRGMIVNSFPLSGHIPFFTRWNEYNDYILKMQIIKENDYLNDFYWDIRPKPEYGTVEVRICDTPLSISRVILITAYLQTLTYYLLSEKPYRLAEDLYLFYNYNRFQACRYGFSANIINPFTHSKISIKEDIIDTLKLIMPYSYNFDNQVYLQKIKELCQEEENDSSYLKNLYKKKYSLENIIQRKIEIFKNDYQ